MKRTRSDWEEATDYGVHGCMTHCLNKVNEAIFELEKYKKRIEELNLLITKLRNTRLAQFLKTSILEDRVDTELARNYPHLREYGMEN